MKVNSCKPILKTVLGFVLVGLVVSLCLGIGNSPVVHAQGAAPTATLQPTRPYFTKNEITLSNGIQIEETIIDGPPTPPPGIARPSVDVPEGLSVQGTGTLSVPAYGWSFGCSATSGAMIAAYYDQNGYSNMYTGPTNGGVMPVDSNVWGTWTDGAGASYAQCPLTASRNGLDGRTTRGSIDDYWAAYNSAAQDPYITGGWAQHSLGDAIGDYMKTSQSAFGNSDGSTAFYNWTTDSTPLTCNDMVTYNVTQDGTYGRKLFYEARGYTVTDCYNQKTDNNGGGFTYEMYKAQIDAGRPVMLNLAGHTVVGVGYDSATNTVYIHDTWDFLAHPMTWGGSYSGMFLQSVSIVNLAPNSPPAVPTGISASDGTYPDRVSIAWNVSNSATYYQVYSNTSNSSSGASLLGSPAASPFNDTSATMGTSYWYFVKACNASGCSGFSASDSGFRALTAPTGVSATDGTYSDHVNITWNASNGATYYQVYRNTSNSSSGASLLASPAASPYNDAAATVGPTYWYFVKACSPSGCSGFSTSDSGYLAWAPSVTSITGDSPDPSFVNQSYTVSVNVTGSSGTPTGSVVVSDGSAGSCTITLSSGTGSCTLTTTTSGSKTLTATYSGSTIYNSSSNSAAHTVNKAVSITTLTNDTPDPSSVKQGYIVSATVSGAYGTPTGTVGISDGTGGSCTITLSSGAGSCALTSSSSGNKTLTAHYAGDNAYNPSSNTADHTVNKATSTTSIPSDTPDPSFVNQSYTVSVTVSGSYGTPTGTVIISDGSANCSVTLASGAGSCALSSITSGSKTLTATYSGDTTYNSSIKTTLHAVNLATSTTSIASDTPDPSFVNQGYTVSVLVSGPYGTPTGSVNISNGSASCPVTLVSGAGSCVLTSTVSGNKTLTASYSGDTAYKTSSNTTAHTVNKAASNTTITNHTPDPSIASQSYTVSITVSGSYGTPIGNVSISDGSGGNCSVTLSAGAGSCALTSTTSGSKSLTANYAGDTTYNTSSANATHTVNKAASITNLTNDTPNPSFVNQSYTVSVTVSGSYGAPTGMVGISDGTGGSCTASLTSGAGSCVLTSMTSGSKTLIATYSGNNIYGASNDSSTHTVNLSPSITSITYDKPDPSFVNQSYTVSVSVSGSYGIPSGSVEITDGKSICTTTLSGGAGACALASTTSGSKTLTATYSGGSTYNPSSNSTGHDVSEGGYQIFLPILIR